MGWGRGGADDGGLERQRGWRADGAKPSELQPRSLTDLPGTREPSVAPLGLSGLEVSRCEALTDTRAAGHEGTALLCELS